MREHVSVSMGEDIVWLHPVIAILYLPLWESKEPFVNFKQKGSLCD